MNRERIIFHIDVNSAFLSWTAVQRLQEGASRDLREVPSVINGDREKRHGVVLAKSIPAAKYGIHTGEPLTDALKKCPFLVTAPPDHVLYHKRSVELMKLLRTYSSILEQLSVDECFLDVTEAVRGYASPEALAIEIGARIANEFGYTVNIGISSRKVLAKMASDFEKPNKVHTLWPEEIRDKMCPLPVGELYMAGKASAAALRKLGIETIGDLAKSDVKILELHLKKHGRILWEYANGIDDRSVEAVRPRAKGVGNSVTLSKDARSEEEAAKVLRSLAESVSKRLRVSRQTAGMVSVEIKYSDFTEASHQSQLMESTAAAGALYRQSLELFKDLWDGRPIRLLGIRASKLSEEGEPVQISLFRDAEDAKRDRLASAVEEIRGKYGADAIRRGVSKNRQD